MSEISSTPSAHSLQLNKRPAHPAGSGKASELQDDQVVLRGARPEEQLQQLKALSKTLNPSDPGIRLHFKVDPRYLMIHTLVGRFQPASKEGSELVRKFQDRAWESDPEACKFLKNHDWPAGSFQESDLLGQRADQLIQKMMHDPDFAVIQSQTQESARRVEREWLEDLAITGPLMKELTGLKLDMDLEVLVTHPSQCNGMSFGKDKILWSERHDFPHYNTVYLWHEAMHKYIKPSIMGDQVGNPSHAVIELLTDNELRARLNGTGYPPFLGHPENGPISQTLLPGWQTYLAQPEKDILSYLKSAEALFQALHVPTTSNPI